MSKLRIPTGPLLAALLLAAAAGADEWRLWPAPGAGASVDLEPGEPSDEPLWVAPGAPLGRTFVPRRSPLVRMDFALGNYRDPRPGSVQLYEWAGSYAATVRQEPLFRDDVELAGPTRWKLLSIFPGPDGGLPVEPGATYLVEFRADGRGRFPLRATSRVSDADGRLLQKGRDARRGRDLWLRTWSSAGKAARASAARASGGAAATGASDPSLAWTPPRELPDVDRQSYLTSVRRFLEAGRDAARRDCRGNVRRALLEAFLYRVSCERKSCQERYAREAVALLQPVYDFQYCTPEAQARAGRCRPSCSPKPEQGLGHRSNRQLATAYGWLRRSPSLEPRDHERLRRLILDSARASWSRRERGVHNRSMTAGATYRIVTALFPDAPEAQAWRRYADDVRNDFRRAGDTEEDAGPYAMNLWWPALLEELEASGESGAAWSDPRFRALVERFAEYVAPVGAPILYGDSSGWAQDGFGLIWLFEKAATAWRDPGYKWLARQLFAYKRAYAHEEPVADDARHKGLQYLARAWLDADDRVPATPPPPLAEALAAHQSREGDHLFRARRVGQRFRVGASPLVRLDLRLAGAGEPGPARVSLYAWRGSPEASAAEPALFAEDLPLDAGDAPRERSVFPFLSLPLGESFYLEVARAAAPFAVAGSAPGSDALADGALFVAGRAQEADLWFRSFTLAGYGSVVTRRHRARPRPREEWGSPRRAWEIESERVPDKLLLRSGPQPDDLFAAFNLLGGYSHGQMELGAALTLLDAGSLLLVDTPFPYWSYEKNPQDESLPLLRRFRGGRLGEPGREAEVGHFADGRNASVAWIEWNDPFGWSVRQERRVFFVKNRFLLVRDRFSFPDAMSVAVGPVWHAADLHPDRGASWFAVYNREPLGDTQRFRNPERYALLSFLERPGTTARGYLEERYLPPAECRNGDATRKGKRGRKRLDCRSSPPYVVYQRWSGDVQPGESRWFDTLVLPFGPGVPPARAAKALRPLHVGDAGVALQVKLGDEQWLLVDNPSGEAFDAGGVSTDARYALARQQKGRPAYLMARDVSRFRFGDVERRWPIRTSVEQGGFPPARLD